MKEVFQRLGYVLYWIGSGVAGILVLMAGGFGIASTFSSSRVGTDDALAVGVVCAGWAALSWLFGRACKYVLAGE
ncbi:hypothetical protein ACT4MK_22185 [Bradyrhizobium barranii]